MRPIRLEIEGLRSFRSAQLIDFTGRDYSAVIGDTGAGKSSILEALTFALYGRTTFSGQGHQELMNSSAQVLRVVLNFEVGGECWEVARTLKRARSGIVTTGPAVLRLLDADGSPVDAVEGVRDVNVRVSAVLGLDADAFLRTVVLPQGQFSRLLVDDDPTRRAGVLRQIWRTDELTEAGALAAQALSELAPLRGRVQQALLTEPDDPKGHLEVLRSKARELGAVAERARSLSRAATKAVQDLGQANERLELASRIHRSLSSWDAASALARADQLLDADRRIECEREALAQEEHRLETVLATIPGDEDGLGLEEVVRFDAALEAIAKQAQSLDEAECEVTDLLGELREANLRLEGARAVEARAREKLDALASPRAALVATEQHARDVLARSRTALAEARDASSSASKSAVKLAEARSVATRMTNEFAQACERSEVAASVTAEAKVNFEAAAQAAAAVAASQGIVAGDPCPVCERELPASWSAPVAPQLDLARTTYEQAAHTAEESRIERGRRQDRAHASEEAVAAREEELRSAGRRSEVSALTLTEILGEPADLEFPDDVVLVHLQRAAERASRALEDHDALAGEQRESHRLAREELTSAAGVSHGLRRQVERAEDRRDRSRTELARQLAALSDECRPQHSDIVAGVARSRAALAERHTELCRRSEERDRVRREIEEIARRRRRLEDQRQAEVVAPVEGLWADACDQRSQVERAVDRLATETPPLPGSSCPPFSGLANALAMVQAATVAVLSRASLAGDEASVQASEAQSLLASLASHLEVASSDGQVVVAAAVEAAEVASLDARAASKEAERFTIRIEAIRALVAAGDRLERAYLALSDLSAALKDGAFPKWLTIRRSRRLLVHASRLLGEMTAGRYAFADLADESTQWAVFDHDSGEARSPASLSGGEKFLASLALALGMVEMMGRRGGRLESLFLDEGFGALDRTNLDAAVEALGTVAATGRMVVVITHVRSVAEQVPHVLSVTRKPTGSEATWLDRAARSSLAEGDLDKDMRLAGLLD